jgi:glycosyltransferase involved in cell wall biosynthesis
MELTILMPCLNEEKTIGTCIRKAQKFIEENNIEGEILIADNGSTDNSIKIAKDNGARVVNIKKKGYGNALRYGSKEAKGIYTIMGDADDSYNFAELEDFIKYLREGYDFVIGNRFKANLEKGAMPLLNRYIGTPIISFIGRIRSKTKIGDFNCGLRGYNTEKINNLNCVCEGMEYATEMVVMAELRNLNITNVPVNLKKDGRINQKTHLRTFRDGFRHLCYMICVKVKYDQGRRKKENY